MRGTAAILAFVFGLGFQLSAQAGNHHNDKSHHPKMSDHDKSHGSHWSYNGPNGPENWGDLKPEFKMCKNGKKQSPIALNWKKPLGKSYFQFGYNEAPLRVIDNGHTVQVNFDKGNWASIHGQKYELLQLHFHAQSEHTISGRRYPLEMHLVHKNQKGDLAVLGVMFVEGNFNPDLDKIWKHLPNKKGEEKTLADVKINPKDLLPVMMSHYHYTGSLTTPPCSEGVDWNVFNTPVPASSAQIGKFREFYANNARPIQPANDRKPANLQ